MFETASKTYINFMPLPKVTFRIPEKDRTKFTQVCTEQGKGKSVVIRELINEYMERQK